MSESGFRHSRFAGTRQGIGKRHIVFTSKNLIDLTQGILTIENQFCDRRHFERLKDVTDVDFAILAHHFVLLLEKRTADFFAVRFV